MFRYRNSVVFAVLLAALCPRTEAVQRTKGIASALQPMTGGEGEAAKEEATDKFVNPFATWFQALDWKAPGWLPANASGFLTNADHSDAGQSEAEKDIAAGAAPKEESVSALQQAGASGGASSTARAIAEKLAADEAVVANRIAEQAEEQRALADDASQQRASADAAEAQRRIAEQAIAEKVLAEQDAAKEAASARIATIDAERAEAEKALAEQAAQDARERAAEETLSVERAAAERLEQAKAKAVSEAAAAAAAEKEAEAKVAAEKEMAERYAAEREADLKEVARQANADRRATERDADLREATDNQAVAMKDASERDVAKQEAVEKVSAVQEATETEGSKKASSEKDATEREAAEREAAAAKDATEKEAFENKVVVREASERDVAVREASDKGEVAKQGAEKESAERTTAEKEVIEKESFEKQVVEKESAEEDAAEKESAEKDAADKGAAEKEAAERAAVAKEAAEQAVTERQLAENATSKEAVAKEAAEKEERETDAVDQEAAAKTAIVQEDTESTVETAPAPQKGETGTEAWAGNKATHSEDGMQTQELPSLDNATSEAKPAEARVQTPLADFEQFEQSLDQEVLDADLQPELSFEQIETPRSFMDHNLRDAARWASEVAGTDIPSAVRALGQNLRNVVTGADIGQAGADLKDAASGLEHSDMVRAKTDEEDVERGPVWDETDGGARRARRKRAVPLSELGKRISDAAWKHNITENVSYNKTSRTCSVGTSGCKSLCRWLKLTDRDFDSPEVPEGSCPLFDWSMESAGYTAPRLRSSDGKAEPVDCVSDLLGQNVFHDDVENYVYQLEECMVGLPQPDSEKYGVSMEVVAGELQDWKDERLERTEAAEVEADLRQAVARGRQAFTYKEGEAEATEHIRAAMKRAERIDGHYLIDDVRTARELLDKLQPLVDVREQLRRGMVRARQALETKAPSALLGALVWLNVSIEGGDKLGLDEPVAEAMEARSNLLEVQEVFWRLHNAMFKANVSAHTKLHVTASIEGLSDAMKRARAVNLTSPLQGGKALLQELGDIRESQQALRNAVYHGEATLTAVLPQSDTPLAFAKDLELLNTSLERAAYLGLPSRDTAPAVSTVARIREATSAKQALRDATRKGHELLVASEGAALQLDDAQENDAMAELREAITWAEHARLEQGVPAARELLRFLNQVRETKGKMLAALVQGNTSLNTSYEEEPAIDALTAALKEERRLNLSAGVDEANQMIGQLKRIRDARSALGAAMVSANRTLHQPGLVPAGAVEHLNESIQEAERMNLGAEASLARRQLARLGALRDAREDLQGTLEQNRLLQSESQERDRADDDEQSIDLLKERRAGFRVAQLPKLASWSDDGDKDFEEHISRLNHSILVARGYGLVDPEMLEQLESLRRLQRAWEALNRTKNEGLEALQSRKDLYKTAVRLEAALERAQASGLSVGLSSSRKVLRDLQELPKARDYLESAMLMGNASLHHKGDLQEALRQLNNAMRRAEPFGLRHMKQAAELRDQLMAMSQAWLKLRTAMVQGTVALRTQRLDNVALQTLQVAVDEAEAKNLREETAPARDLLLELASLHAQLHRLDEAVFTRNISNATGSDEI